MLEIIYEQVKFRVIASKSFTLQAVLDGLRVKYTSDVCYSQGKQEHIQIYNKIGSLGLASDDVVVVK